MASSLVVMIGQELKESGELQELVPRAQSLDDRLRELISREHIMLFMKGSVEVSSPALISVAHIPSQSPQCGFSRSMCQILQEQG